MSVEQQTDADSLFTAVNLEKRIADALVAANWTNVRKFARHKLELSPDDVAVRYLLLVACAQLGRWREAFIARLHLMNLNRSYEEAVEKEMWGDARLNELCCFLIPGERLKLYVATLSMITLLVTIASLHIGLLFSGITIAVLLTILVTFELLYRVYLYRSCGIAGERYAFPCWVKPSDSFVEVYDRNPIVFERTRGFDHVASDEFVRIVIQGDKVLEAHVAGTDENGNVGFSDTEFHPDSLNILVVGDSYTSFLGNGSRVGEHEGVEWPFFLKGELVKHDLPNVRILNFARSGHGVLQMADTAASLVQKFKPDIVLFAFITRDLNRFRVWQDIRRVGDQDRYFRFTDPNASLEDCRDTFLVDARITIDWARARMAAGDRDAVIDDLMRKQQDLTRRASARAINLLSTNRMYFCDYLFFGSPFLETHASARTVWAKTPLKDFADDAQFVSSIDEIKRSGAKILLVHIPTAEELAEKNLKLKMKADLYTSLGRITGESIWYPGNVSPEIKSVALQRYPRYPHDGHPSTWAQKFIAEFVALVFQHTQLGHEVMQKKKAAS